MSDTGVSDYPEVTYGTTFDGDFFIRFGDEMVYEGHVAYLPVPIERLVFESGQIPRIGIEGAETPIWELVQDDDTREKVRERLLYQLDRDKTELRKARELQEERTHKHDPFWHVYDAIETGWD